MSYELINKDLNMWSCSISDLTMEQVNYFLCQWPETSSNRCLRLMTKSSVYGNKNYKNLTINR